jgi:hypothetical protein
MKALRDIPYPSASPDSSIFESWSNEYDRVRLPWAARAQWSIGEVPFSLSANEGHNPCDVLQRLCRNRKFAEAEDIRQELVGMNIPIRPSSTYALAAWHVLRQRPWPPNRTEMFANWLSLLPDQAQDNLSIRLANLKSALLFNSKQLDLGTVSQFGIILSSKGFIRIVGANVIACLTRYAHPDVSSRILDEMIAADDDYKRKKLGVSGNMTSRQFKHTSKRLWSVAVRTHCTAGRPEVAFQMVKRAHEHGIHITQYSYQYLLGKLEADGLKEFAAEVRALPNCGSLDVAKRRLVIQEVSDPRPTRPISHKQNKTVNGAIAFAILQRCSRTGLPAYATDLVPYFDLYKTDLRGEGVNWLRSRAQRLSHLTLSTVLLAELLHHHRRGQFRHVLWVFEKFFDVVTVPSEDVTRRLWKRHHYPPHMHLHYWSLPLSIRETTFNLPSRLWPSTHHTALVWSALVHLCESEDELFALYDQLLEHSTRFLKPAGEHGLHSHRHRHHYHCHGSHDHSMTPTAAPADRYDSAHFQPFLIAFTLLRGAQYGLRVLDDMQDRGVAPSSQTLSIAAALQARHGEPALALRMLDVYRGTIERGEDEEAGEAETQRQRKVLAAYTSVLRGFADRRDLVLARRVAGMLAEQLGYVEGNARTDAVLRYVRRLEVEGPDAEPEPFAAEADDDWQQQQQQRYLYPFLKQCDPEVGLPSLLFFFCRHIPTLPLPGGEVVNRTFCDVLALRLKFTRGVDCFTVQFIKTLNAAPVTN